MAKERPLAQALNHCIKDDLVNIIHVKPILLVIVIMHHLGLGNYFMQ